LIDRQIDLFGGTELIALDILDKTEKNAGAQKKHRGYLIRCPTNDVRLMFPWWRLCRPLDVLSQTDR